MTMVVHQLELDIAKFDAPIICHISFRNHSKSFVLLGVHLRFALEKYLSVTIIHRNLTIATHIEQPTIHLLTILMC